MARGQGRGRLLHKVGAGNARLVGVVQDKAEVADKGGTRGVGRREQVAVRDIEGVGRDLAVLARQITDLARLLEGGVTGWVVVADKGVEVACSGGAVAVGRDGRGVDVVGEGPTGLGQVGEADGESNADAIRARLGPDAALDVATVGEGGGVKCGSRQGGNVGDIGGVVDGDGSVTTGLSVSVCSR